MRLKNEETTYDFMVEFERSREAEEIKKEKFFKTEEVDFRKNGLSPNTKILFVFTTDTFDVFLRPLEYPRYHKNIHIVERHFNKLLGVASYLPANKYRFACLHDFTRLNERVWFDPQGRQVKLINN